VYPATARAHRLGSFITALDSTYHLGKLVWSDQMYAKLSSKRDRGGSKLSRGDEIATVSPVLGDYTEEMLNLWPSYRASLCIFFTFKQEFACIFAHDGILAAVIDLSSLLDFITLAVEQVCDSVLKQLRCH
jgi:hypothetical protein